MKSKTLQLLRQLPSIHEFVQQKTVQTMATEAGISKDRIISMSQAVIDQTRAHILSDELTGMADIEAFNLHQYLIEQLHVKVNNTTAITIKPLINGTGVILHTNLGRAKLSNRAKDALLEVATHYSNLEYRLNEGVRGSRHDLVSQLICELTGAEAAIVCNNNAAAVFLVLREMAAGKEVLVSRGELVEIGGSFRVSEIMRESGARLVEIGTTNKTHLYDYEQAITEETSLMMKVHTSNFVIKGFTAKVSGTELSQLAHKHHIPVFEDLGSGVLYDLKTQGIGEEPTVQEVLKEGVDLVSFSGDKLLGGPQAGIIAGKKKYIERLKKNQLMRSLRVDKFTLAALHATLAAYLNPQTAKEEIPTLRMILQPLEDIKSRVDKFISMLIPSTFYSCKPVQTTAEIGGGTMPEVQLPSWGVEIQHTTLKVNQMAACLREAPFPIIGRIYQDSYILDFRTIEDHELPLILNSMHEIRGNGS